MIHLKSISYEHICSYFQMSISCFQFDYLLLQIIYKRCLEGNFGPNDDLLNQFKITVRILIGMIR